MKYIQDNGKIKLCETDNMDHLVRLTQALNENNIPYETRLKKATFLNNLFFLIFYHTFASGIDHKNETTCIYVLEKDFDAAQKAIVNYRETAVSYTHLDVYKRQAEIFPQVLKACNP